MRAGMLTRSAVSRACFFRSFWDELARRLDDSFDEPSDGKSAPPLSGRPRLGSLGCKSNSSEVIELVLLRCGAMRRSHAWAIPCLSRQPRACVLPHAFVGHAARE